MNHHVRTTYGDSKISASRSSWQAPIAGIGQGNGAGPHIWVAVSSPMFDIMRSDSFYAHVVTSISKMKKKLVGFAFVDDTDLCVFGPMINSSNVLQTMQQSINNWEGLLRATGGALVPSKCFWYLLDFHFENNRWTYSRPHQARGAITIRDDNLRRVEIPRLCPSEARQTLGVRLAPDGNWNTKVDYLLSVASDWKVRMAAAKLNPVDAMFSLKNVVCRKLCYPLVTTTFSRSQCKKIMSPLLQQGLPRAGFNRNFPRDLAHGPTEYGGIDIPHLFTEQIIAHVTMVLRYGPEPKDPTGVLLHAMGEAMRLEAVYNGELLEIPLILADNLTPSWIKHVWQSTQEVGVTLATDFAEVTPRRQGDIELMRLFVNYGIKQPELYTLNLCRMFLKVFLVSDITSSSGDVILPSFWDRPTPAHSELQWPNTFPPPNQAWLQWRRALTDVLHLGRHQRLALPLGQWSVQTSPQGWYYHPSTNSLWEVGDSKWIRHGGIPQRTRQRLFHQKGEHMTPPRWRT